MQKIILLLFLSLSLNASPLEIEWKVKNDKNIKEYRLEYGCDSGVSVTIRLDKINHFKIDLLEGRTYWFQVTPIDVNNQLGKKSNVIYYTVPINQLNDFNEQPQLQIKK